MGVDTPSVTAQIMGVYTMRQKGDVGRYLPEHRTVRRHDLPTTWDQGNGWH